MGLLDQFDAVIGASFGLKVDGLEIKGIKDVSGLKQEFDFIEVKTQTMDGKYHLKKIPGRQKPVTVTLTRPLTEDDSFQKWMQLVADGKLSQSRKAATITVYDTEYKPVKTFTVVHAQPSALEVTQMAAGANNTVEEKLTLQGEELKIDKA